MTYKGQHQPFKANYTFRFYNIKLLAITISYRLYMHVTDGSRVTNLVAMVAVKANLHNDKHLYLTID
ncbi:MAG: hypothetical protein WCF03_12020 [Nitrososphaeraceae archaeon]